MAFGTKQISTATPAWVIKVVAACTFVLQGLPHVLGQYEFISPHALEVVNLSCDLGNMGIAAMAIFFGVPEKNNEP